MKKVVLIPDSFKGTMDSRTICALMREVILRHYPEAEVVSLPVADGGEGTVDSLLEARGGQKIHCRVQGPLFEELDAFYGLMDQGKTAVVEMAACAGLPLMGDRKDPLMTTTYGVGQLMLEAARQGVSRIILGLGGSATNDGGCGAAAAAGVRFLDRAGQAFVPVGGTLGKIGRIEADGLSRELTGLLVTAMCDIDNPLYGPQGSAFVFGPQKGADPADVERLDAGLRHLAAVIERDLGLDVARLPGAGAAGGMGAGASAFFGADLQRGIEVVLDAVAFEDRAAGADLIMTGEGRIDQQSLGGKVVVGVGRRAKKMGIPAIALVGDIGERVGAIYSQGISGIFSINRQALPLAEARKRSAHDLELTVDNLMRLFKRMERGK